LKFAGDCALLSVLALSGCGGLSVPGFYSGPEPKAGVVVIEGYEGHYGLFAEKTEITGVDLPAEGGTARGVLGVTRAQAEPGQRCVELEIKKCGGGGLGGCGEPTVCAFADYMVAGQLFRLKGGTLKLDKPASPGDSPANGTIQIEVSSKGFATVTRRINVSCGSAIRGVCERGTPELPSQPVPRK
jgi:hypothetical protein